MQDEDCVASDTLQKVANAVLTLTNKGASVCPTKMFPAADNDSEAEVPKRMPKKYPTNAKKNRQD